MLKSINLLRSKNKYSHKDKIKKVQTTKTQIMVLKHNNNLFHYSFNLHYRAQPIKIRNRLPTSNSLAVLITIPYHNSKSIKQVTHNNLKVLREL